MTTDLLQDLKKLIRSIEDDIDNYEIYNTMIDTAHINAKNEVVLDLLDLVSKYED